MRIPIRKTNENPGCQKSALERIKELIKNVAITALIICCIGFFIATSCCEDEQQSYYVPDRIESYTAGDFDQLQIWKIYQLSSTDDPAHISTRDFELNGWTYHMLEMDKEELDGQITYTVIFNGIKTQ